MAQGLDRLHLRCFDSRLKAGRHGDNNNNDGYGQQIGWIKCGFQKKSLLLAEIKTDTDKIDDQYDGTSNADRQ